MYLAEVFDAEYQVIVSRILWGGYSSPIKAYVDRLLPLLHPFFRKLKGEMHHRLRYSRTPGLLVVGFGAESGAEEGTFRALAEAHGDNLGSHGGNNVFIYSDGEAAGLGPWFAKAAGL